MIVVFGANGMTGREIIKEAKRNKLAVRPVVRHDHDTKNIEGLVEVNEITFADADHYESLAPAMKGATAVISCLDARTCGWGGTVYDKMAAANVVNAAHELNIPKILHLSVMGAYRWSPNPLNRQSFHLDRWVKRSKVPWTMLRVSCYHDELIDGHLRPPDGGRPHKIHPSARYAPVSRQETAKAIITILPRLIPSRTWLFGGPKVYSGTELQKLAEKYAPKSTKKTARGPLPHGDMSIATDTTEAMFGWVPQETLEWALDPENNPLYQNTEQPFWNRDTAKYHSADQKKNLPIFETMNLGLRYALHAGLFADLNRIKLQDKRLQFDFSKAQRKKTFKGMPHKALMNEMSNVQVKSPKGETVHTGDITFVYDDLADEFIVWWDNTTDIPVQIWDDLDLGVRRRLIKHSRWKQDDKVLQFAAQLHEQVSLKK